MRQFLGDINQTQLKSRKLYSSECTSKTFFYVIDIEIMMQKHQKSIKIMYCVAIINGYLLSHYIFQAVI